MKVLGIDPDTAFSGWVLAVFDGQGPNINAGRVLSCGVVKSNADLTHDARVMDQVATIWNQAFDPAHPLCQAIAEADACVVEGQYMIQGTKSKGRSADDLFKVAHVAGAFMLAARGKIAETHELNPTLWTQSTDKPARMHKFKTFWFPDETDASLMLKAGCTLDEVNHVMDGGGMTHWYAKNHLRAKWLHRHSNFKKPASPRGRGSRRGYRRRK